MSAESTDCISRNVTEIFNISYNKTICVINSFFHFCPWVFSRHSIAASNWTACGREDLRRILRNWGSKTSSHFQGFLFNFDFALWTSAKRAQIYGQHSISCCSANFEFTVVNEMRKNLTYAEIRNILYSYSWGAICLLTRKNIHEPFYYMFQIILQRFPKKC